MAIALEDGGADSVGFGVANRNVVMAGIPADNEYILLFAVVNDAFTTNTPAGFTSLYTSAATGGRIWYIFGRVASGEASATYTVSFSGTADEGQAWGLVFSGVDTATPQDAANTTSATSFPGAWPDIIAPTITPVTDGAWHIAAGFAKDSITTGTPSGYTDTGLTDGNTRSCAFYKVISPAAATGAITVATSSSGSTMNVSMVLRPGGAPPPIQFDPVGYPDGALAGWTTVGGGYGLGKAQASVADRFVAYNGGYDPGFFGCAIYGVPTIRAEHIFTGEFIVATGEGIRVYVNSNPSRTAYNEVVLYEGGAWEFNYHPGGIASGSGTGITDGVSFDVEIDATTAGTVIIKVDGSTVHTSSTNIQSGLHVALLMGGAATAGVFNIGPVGAGSPRRKRYGGVAFSASSARLPIRRW